MGVLYQNWGKYGIILAMKALNKISVYVVLLSALLFTGIAVFVAVNTSSMMTEEAVRTVRSVVKTTVGRIDRLMSEVELAANNSVWLVGEHIDDPNYMYKITQELVGNNEFVVGSTVAFRPNYYKEHGYFFAPYSYQNERGEMCKRQLGTAENDYFTQEWYSEPMKSGVASWCEPYFDEGGGKILMSTYSVPVKDAKGETYAILTADLSLEQLRGYVAAIRPYPQSYAILKSAKGEYLVGPPKGVEIANDKTIMIKDKAENGWSVEIVCPMTEILKSAQRLVIKIIIFSASGLALIFLLSWFYSSRLQRATAERERIASELTIASKIQAGILPRVFPDYVAAKLRPAREVGGDLYDFIERDGKIYFLIGDASGKGVPAALFSFMAVTTFRLSCAMGLSSAEIIQHINAILVNGNDMSMFVTAFVGILDFKNGKFEYCNGGHNPPIIISPNGKTEFLEVKRNLPCGVMEGYEFKSQSIDICKGAKMVVYTDGVTEAEKADHSQFGENRLMEFALNHKTDDAKRLVASLFNEVDKFVAGAEQSDDITVMAIAE